MRVARWLVLAVPVVLVATASPAFACAGLVGENGTIQLTRTSTLAAYHDGVERYVTSFQFTGEGKELGSIIPLPDVPTKVERGGDWTLQRLAREVAPPVAEAAFDCSTCASVAAPRAEVLLETKIDALDITVLKGGGTEVGKWAVDHGFFLTPDAPEMLDFYSSRSQIFMAARFDVARAQNLGQSSGDGTPIMLTIPTDAPWVPLRILSLGRDSSEFVNADVFLLTDREPKLLAGGPGLALERHEWASSSLLDDLRSDKGMEWMPSKMWFTYLAVDAAAGDLDYDLAVAVDRDAVPSVTDTGVQAPEARSIDGSDDFTWWPIALAAIVGAGAFVLTGLVGRRNRALVAG